MKIPDKEAFISQAALAAMVIILQKGNYPPNEVANHAANYSIALANRLESDSDLEVSKPDNTE